MLCKAKRKSLQTTSSEQVRNLLAESRCNQIGEVQKRYLLSTEESARLRSYLLDYIQADPDESSEAKFIVRIAHIAAEHKRLILTTQELSRLQTLLSFEPKSKEQV